MLAILQAAGWPIWLLLIASIVALALIIERTIYLRRAKLLPRQLLDEVIRVYHNGKITPDIIEKLQANSPLGGIAPKDARPILKTEIDEYDRAFLNEGLPVKLKFNAFPYQRYGLISGTLEYISPATKPALQTKQPVYEGRVALERDHYLVADKKYPLRYGMTATVEIVVRERRLIDLALDPFRQIGG